MKKFSIIRNIYQESFSKVLESTLMKLLTNPRTSQDISLASAANLKGNAMNITNIHQVTNSVQQSQLFLHVRIASVI